MLVRKSFLFRLRPTKKQAKTLQSQLDECRWLYNELLEQRKPKTVRLPALRDDLTEARTEPTAEPNLLEATTRADQCVERLRQNPNDAPARERLAILLAERLGKADLAIEQLDLLLAMPDQPEQKCAEWLALTAAWQMRYRQDPGAA